MTENIIPNNIAAIIFLIICFCSVVFIVFLYSGNNSTLFRMAVGYDIIMETGLLNNGGNIARVNKMHKIIHSIVKIISYDISITHLCQHMFRIILQKFSSHFA
jgi:hypothetical protein